RGSTKVDVTARTGRNLMGDVDHAAERIPQVRLASRSTGERGVVLQLESREAAVVDTGEAEHLRRDGVLRVRAPFLGIEAESRNRTLRERSRARGIGSAGDVDEAELPVG